MRIRPSTSNLEEPTINLTPLIDVVFVILIMFIIIAPLLETDRISLAPSHKSSDSTTSENSPLAIHVFEDNHITINNEETPLLQLTAALKLVHEKFPTARPQLFHDQRASFGTYQRIKRALENAGFDEVDVILNPE